ncbi:MAG: AmmeMemoRadiSam system radical SAM enzyme [Thermodesulfovibrionales bacterium]|nr:AmmeMemoRadiSam system radical SAM enzyme [Thermodesulfovibrionales bacterium]
MAKRVQCELCPNGCVLELGQHSKCRARMNKDGTLYSLVYGKPCAVHVDPIEKKPFFHFLPGTTAFSIATAGCVLSCKFCQNWQISQAKPEDTDTYDLPPEKVVSNAIAYKCRSVTYTYTEPTVFYEYMYDTAVIAKKQGIRNTMHSCGYINEKPLRTLSKFMDAADIDLKGFTEDFYSRICSGSLRPVLNSLVILKEEGVWLEITNLVIPTLNDDLNNVREMSRWIVKNLGADVPIHFSRFFPHYKLTNLPPTPIETLEGARKTAMDAGLKFVYIGNILHEGENTFCPKCKKVLIERMGYFVKQNYVANGKCKFCSSAVAGVWS